MAKAWKDVIASQQYQSLPPEQKAQAQEQYFNEVVAPQAGQNADQAKQAFYNAYPVEQSKPAEQTAPQENKSLMQRAGDWLTGGQSAGHILEQAARGLVNIPFDILQGGANLINAGTSAVGLGDVLDPVYRPVDRPTDTYAQAGEAIGGYLMPIGTAAKSALPAELLARSPSLAGGISAAGNMITGSLAEASNQQGDFTANAAKNAAINLGAQGLLSGAANAIGRGVTAVRGEISQVDRQLLKQASTADVPVMTSDVIKPTTKLGNQLQGYSEGVIAGTGPMRSAQQDARTKLISRFTENYGDYDPSVVVDSLKSGLAREKNIAKTKLNNLSGRMVGKRVDTDGAIRAIDGAVNELRRLKGVSDTQTISALNDYKRAIQETSTGDDAFELLDKLRTQFRIDVKGDRAVLPSQSQAMVDRVYNSLTNSLNKSIAKGLGSKDAAAWRAGKADYARMATDVTQTRLKNVLNKGDLTPEAVNTIVYGQYGSDIARLYGKLDPKGKDMLRAAYISKIAGKAGDSPQRIMSELSKLQKQANGHVFKTVFGGKSGKEIEGLISILDATKRASEANVVTKTGMTLAPLVRVIGNLKTGGGLLAGETGIGLMSRVYESPMTRNALLRLANTKAGTPAYERALNQAANMVRPILANQATQQE